MPGFILVGYAAIYHSFLRTSEACKCALEVCRCKETTFELLAIWMLFLFREGRMVPTVLQCGGRVVLLGCFAGHKEPCSDAWNQ